MISAGRKEQDAAAASAKLSFGEKGGDDTACASCPHMHNLEQSGAPSWHREMCPERQGWHTSVHRPRAVQHVGVPRREMCCSLPAKRASLLPSSIGLALPCPLPACCPLSRTTLCIRQILQMTFWSYIFSLSAFWIYFSSLPPCFILSVFNCRECQNILPHLEICSQVISSNTTDLYPFSALICWELSSAISDINTALFCIALYPRNPLKSLCSSN